MIDLPDSRHGGSRLIFPVSRLMDLIAVTRTLRSLLFLIAAGPISSAYAATETDQQAKPPAEALAALKTPDDLVVEQVLTEPDVRQPLFIDFDERGRLWVAQYLQYP